MKALQKSSIAVVRGDWKMHIGKELQDGMCFLTTNNKSSNSSAVSLLPHLLDIPRVWEYLYKRADNLVVHPQPKIEFAEEYLMFTLYMIDNIDPGYVCDRK